MSRRPPAAPSTSMQSHSQSGSLPTVAHIVSSYLFQTGSWIYTQLTHMQSVRPVVLTYRLENLDQFPFAPIHLYRSPLPGAARWRAYARRLYEAVGHDRERFFAQAVRAEGARLLHAHFGPVGHGNLGVQRRTGLPLVTTFYGYDVSLLPQSRPVWRRRYRALFEAGALFLAEGPHMGQCLVELGCPADKVRVQRLGVDLERIQFAARDAAPGEAVRVLLAASFREKKGIPYGIEAFARAARRHPQAELRIVGGARTEPERALMEECRRLAAREGVGDRVHFLGYTSYAEYVQELEQAHLFLAPSVHARDGDTEGGAPVSLIEAAAAGLPAVASRHCDIPEVVCDGETGLLVAERDVEGLAAALETLLAAPSTWAAMGRAARAHVEANFSIRTQVARLESHYAALLG